MKLSYLICFCLAFNTLSAQSKTERYCEVEATKIYGFQHKTVKSLDVKIDSGFATPTTENISISQKELEPLIQQKSVAAVLNYMAKKGWTLVSTTDRLVFYFKKED